jgi:succinate dehydrogenase/fumarate reductase cytochrome b subunit
MNRGKVRTLHRHLGITLVVFLLVQALAGALMSLERLAALENSKPYNILYTLHAD